MKDNHRDRERDRSRSNSREREKRDISRKSYQKPGKKHPLKLHVGNLPLNTTEDDVRYQFEKFGKVDDVKIIRKNANGQPLREFLYGFIVMANEDEGREAMEIMNQNRDLGWTVSFSKDKGKEDPRRSPERNSRKEKRPFEDDHPQRRDGQQNIESEKKRDRDDSPDEASTRDKETGGSSALLSLINGNFNGSEEEKQTIATNLMTLLQLPPEKLIQLTSSMEKNLLNGSAILVRELWLGNLPENLSDKKLKNTVEMFGDVENIEYYNKPQGSFAFVKFRKVSQASKANEGAQNMRLLLDSPNLKIAFSDHQRRKNVVGDHPDFEDPEDLTSIVYIGYTSGTTVAPESVIKEMFSRYGEVLTITIKQTPKDNSAKSYVLVEMASLEEARTARKRIYLMDDKKEKRARLGDKNCELAILVKAKNKEPTTPTPQNPMQGPQHPQMFPNQPGPFGPPGGNFPPMQNMPFNPNFNPNFPNPNPNARNFYNPMPQISPQNRFMPQPGMPGQFNPQMNFPPNMVRTSNPNIPKQEEKKGQQFEILDQIQNLIQSHAAAQPEQIEEEKKNEPEEIQPEVQIPLHHHSDDLGQDTIWSGFITKSKQNRVGVDAILIKGEENILKEYYNLNISHRTVYDEVLKKNSAAIVKFVPANQTQEALFTDYLKYFLEKQRAGVVSLKKHVLYLLPPTEETFKIHPFGNNEILGVFVNIDEVSAKDSQRVEEKGSVGLGKGAESVDNSIELDSVLNLLENPDLERLVNQSTEQ